MRLSRATNSFEHEANDDAEREGDNHPSQHVCPNGENNIIELQGALLNSFANHHNL